MTVLSRLAKLGMALEPEPNTYTVPAWSIPFNSGTKYVNTIPPIRDESMRASDTVLQGLYQGPATSDWSIEVNSYPDLAGHWFRAMIGPDTVIPGVSTVLSADTDAGATSVSLEAEPAADAILQISDASGANLEYVQIGTPTGAGPYACPITAGSGAGGNSTKYAHTADDGSVVSQTIHTFTQNRTFTTVWPTWSFTTNDGPDQLGWAGCVLSDLGLKIDTKGMVAFSNKYTGFPQTSEADFTYAASSVSPLLGWAWTVTNAGAASTRGLSMDITLKRATEAIIASDGTQGPREIFPGPLEIDGAYKAIFENDADISLFLDAIQEPTVHTITQPLAIGGQSIAVTMSQSGYTTGEKDLGGSYVQLSQALSGINNMTDGGVTSVVLTNFVGTSY